MASRVDMEKLREEVATLIVEIHKQLQLGVCVRMCKRPGETLKLQSIRLEFNKPSDINLCMIVSAFEAVKEPIMVVRIEVDESKLDEEFEVIEEEETKLKCIDVKNLQDSSVFNKTEDDISLRNPNFFKLNLRMWRDFYTNVMSLREADFKTHRYRLKDNDKFILTLYQVYEFNDIVFTHSTAFLNEARDEEPNPKAMLIEAVKESEDKNFCIDDISRFVEDHYPLIEEIKNKGNIESIKASMTYFGKKETPSEATPNKHEPAVLKVGNEFLTKIREELAGVSFIRLEPTPKPKNKGHKKTIDPFVVSQVMESSELQNSEVIASEGGDYDPEDESKLARLEMALQGGLEDSYAVMEEQGYLTDLSEEQTPLEPQEGWLVSKVKAESALELDEPIGEYL